MAKHEKCTADIRVHLGETLKSDLRVLAGEQGFENLSTFIRKILREYTYGKCSPQRDLLAQIVRDE